MGYVAERRLQIQQNGFALSKTFGTSMRPLIWGGRHFVAVVPLEGEPAVGDLLMFKQTIGGQEKNIVHRLVEIRQVGDRCQYITRGDNCLGCEQVNRAEIIGRVAEVHRISGYRPWYVIPAKRFAVTGPAYMRYSRFWTAIWPARRLYYRLRGCAYSMLALVMSIFKKDR